MIGSGHRLVSCRTGIQIEVCLTPETNLLTTVFSVSQVLVLHLSMK